MCKKTHFTDEEKKTNIETWKHINNVELFLSIFCGNLIERGKEHDRSKLERPEVEVFTIYTPKLKGTTYGSDEYKQYLKEMKVALDHHYKNNRHHPEHFENGINDMNLLDLIEMFCDWKAATLRHADGDMKESIKINAERFKLSGQLEQILMNTVNLFEGER